MSIANEMDLPASESEPLVVDNNSAEVDHPHQHQAVVGPQIERTRLATDIVQQLTGINVLLVFVPLGFAAGLLKANAVMVATFNFLAIIPLSALVSDSSDKLSDSLGPLWGGLINATFGNAVELIVSYIVLAHGNLLTMKDR
jgi:Sodium/calcium exchanger protein